MESSIFIFFLFQFLLFFCFFLFFLFFIGIRHETIRHIDEDISIADGFEKGFQLVEWVEDSHAEWPINVVWEVLDLDTLGDGDSSSWVEVLEHLGEGLWLIRNEAEGSIGDDGISLFIFW